MKLGLKHIRSISRIITLLIIVGCRADSPPAKDSSSEQSPSARTTGRLTHQSVGVEHIEATLKRSEVCPVDTRGTVRPGQLSQARSTARLRAWGRERSLSLSANWLSLLPNIEPLKQKKVVSLEIYRGARSGRIEKDYQCLRWRVLSGRTSPEVLAELNALFKLTAVTPSLFQANLMEGVMRLNVGMNEQAVTQLDFSLVPNQALPLDLAYADEVPLVQWLKSFRVVGFEYGIYISGRKGLRYPGLRRTVMVVDVSQDVVDSQLRKLGFVRDKGDKRVFTKGSQTVTSRGYLGQPLSVSWQHRLPMQTILNGIAE